MEGSKDMIDDPIFRAGLAIGLFILVFAGAYVLWRVRGRPESTCDACGQPHSRCECGPVEGGER